MVISPDETLVIFDERAWPLVVISFPSEHVALEVLEEYFPQMEELMARGKPFAMMVDVRSVTSSLDSTIRGTLSEWLKKTSADRGRTNACVALLVKSAFIRGIVTGLLWLRDPSERDGEHRMLSTAAEGVNWCIEKLQNNAAVDDFDPDEVRRLLAKYDKS